MTAFTVAVRIDAPVETVNEVLLDADAAPMWTSGLERLELVEGKAGTPGSVGHAHYVERGRRYVLVDTLLDAQPGRRYRSRVTGSGMHATAVTTLGSLPDGATCLAIEWRGHGTNPATWVALVLSRRRIRARAEADLERFRAVVEDSSGPALGTVGPEADMG